MTKKRFTLLYGASKVNFSAIAPAICEYTDNYVLVITSSENFSGYENKKTVTSIKFEDGAIAK